MQETVYHQGGVSSRIINSFMQSNKKAGVFAGLNVN